MSIKKFIIRHKKLFGWVFVCWTHFKDIKLYFSTISNINKGIHSRKRIIYYCGIPAHGNLGDLAQGVCIRRWISEHYPNFYLAEIETNALVNTRHSCLKKLGNVFNNERDFVIFQSGYTTTDLGGFADIMHQAVIKTLPNARILMMPQTIFFKSDERKKLCSKVYNSHKNMLFLARDTVSYSMAEDMFPDLNIKCFPDIVTTLIGSMDNNEKKIREGIIFCLRDDSEKFYSDSDLQILIDKCEKTEKIRRTDTTKGKAVVKDAESYIFAEIEEYSKYKVMITDRYHGTILSLVAGTPVIIIKTTDHKVTTGADWFKNVYDDHVYLAQDLEDAYRLAIEIINKDVSYSLPSYFKEHYYDKLPYIFENMNN